jgi:hypothetical protein
MRTLISRLSKSPVGAAVHDPKRPFSALFDHLVGGHLHDHGYREAERLRRLEVDHELEFCGLAPRFAVAVRRLY